MGTLFSTMLCSLSNLFQNRFYISLLSGCVFFRFWMAEGLISDCLLQLLNKSTGRDQLSIHISWLLPFLTCKLRLLNLLENWAGKTSLLWKLATFWPGSYRTHISESFAPSSPKPWQLIGCCNDEQAQNRECCWAWWLTYLFMYIYLPIYLYLKQSLIDW